MAEIRYGSLHLNRPAESWGTAERANTDGLRSPGVRINRAGQSGAAGRVVPRPQPANESSETDSLKWSQPFSSIASSQCSYSCGNRTLPAAMSAIVFFTLSESR